MSELIFTKAGLNILSGNAIDFEVAITPYNYTTDGDNVYLVIAISENVISGSTVLKEVRSQKFYPNADGLVSVDISSIIDAYLEYFVPPCDLDTLMLVPYGQYKNFSVKFSLFNALVLVTESAKNIMAIKAGATYQYFNTDLTYPSSGTQKMLYLTDGKDKVHADDIFFLYFTMVPIANTRIIARYVVNYLLDGVTASIGGAITGILDPTAIMAIACLPAGFNQLNLQATLPAGAVAIDYSISVFKKDTADVETPYLESIKFVIEQRNFYNTVQLVYRNSLGGLTPLRLRGEIDTNTDYTFQNITKLPPPSYLLDGNIIGTMDQTYNEEDEKFTGETGFISKYQADRLRDFFLSKQRFEVKDGRLIPIILNTKTTKFYTNRDNLISVQIDWQHAFTNNFYSNTNMPPDVCPAINFLQWRQTNNEEITVFWAFPFGYAYGTISLEFPGEDPQPFELNGNSGLVKIMFVRPASADGVDVDVIMKANVICHRYNNTPTMGPQTVLAAQTISAKKNPVAVDDIYNIAAGYITDVTLSGSTLGNDYDPGGLPIEVIAASGATTEGGSYTIDAAGNVTYTPPSSSFNGADTFIYNIRETPSGTPVPATVTINVGTVSLGIYAKVVLRGYNTAYSNNGQVWIDFFSNPAGTIPVDVSSAPFTVNYNEHKHEAAFGGLVYTGPADQDFPASAAATGFKVQIFNGPLYLVFGTAPGLPGTYAAITRTFAVTPGTGYTAI